MTLAALGLGVVALIGVAAVVLIQVCSTRRLEAALERPQPLVGRYVQLNTKRPDDQTLRGVCVEEFPDGSVMLAGAEYLEPGGNPLDAGQVYVPISSIAFVQCDVVRDDGSARAPLPRAA